MSNQNLTQISEKEKQVILKIAEGKSTKIIAYELGRSKNTIESQRSNIAEKLGFSSIALLTRFAIRQGWIEP